MLGKNSMGWHILSPLPEILLKKLQFFSLIGLRLPMSQQDGTRHAQAAALSCLKPVTLWPQWTLPGSLSLSLCSCSPTTTCHLSLHRPH